MNQSNRDIQEGASDPRLVEAVRRWQSGREGSSLLRGAARVLTGVPHYFEADFIADYEARAKRDRLARSQARLLMDEIAMAATRSSLEWHASVGLPGSAFAGRGIKSKPHQDGQILESLARGTLVMPLWGFSLREDVALAYGTRFIFRIEGPFRGVAAWQVSGDQEDQAEIIASGEYEVHTEDQNGSTLVTLREVGGVTVPAD